MGAGEGAMRRRSIPRWVRAIVLTREEVPMTGEWEAAHCNWCPFQGEARWDADPLTIEVDQLEWDHVVPVSRGGGNTPDNIVLSCLPCNRSRGARLPEEWPEYPWPLILAR